MTTEVLTFLTDQKRLSRYFSDLLLLSLFILADGWLLVRVSRHTGVYLALALEGSTAILGLTIVGSSIRGIFRQLDASVVAGHFRPRLFARLAVIVAASTFLLLPGFVSDLVGLLLYLPPGRHIAGWLLWKRNKVVFRQVYEYLALEIHSRRDTSPSTPGARSGWSARRSKPTKSEEADHRKREDEQYVDDDSQKREGS